MTEVERADGKPEKAEAETADAAESEATTATGTGSGKGERPTTGGRRRVAELAIVAALAYALDLITKILVVEKLEGHDPIEVIGTWLRFQAVRNPGAAFGIGEALTIVFTIIAAIVIVVIVRIARKLYSTPWAVALGLLLGGALGNLTDRVFRSPGVFQGHVVDFIAPAHFAVFNLADTAIVCGGVLIVILSFRGLDPDGTVHRD
ncbi:signal peptidase II [Streptomyces megasporus]|uniref:signal peptidase II n=1 Tax=Streptomyces megasporus TaxID=44060 RepID=UPI0004E0D900|nr:signal peptidase II [Streptomyces megasporus]